MNVFLWILQILLALHTVVGALWKASHPEQAVPELKALPHDVWIAMSVIEIFFALGLILPLFSKRFSRTAPVAAICIAIEMLLFIFVTVFSAGVNYGHIIYWLVVAAVCAFIVYGRTKLKPLGASVISGAMSSIVVVFMFANVFMFVSCATPVARQAGGAAATATASASAADKPDATPKKSEADTDACMFDSDCTSGNCDSFGHCSMFSKAE